MNSRITEFRFDAYSKNLWTPEYPIEAHPAFTLRSYGETIIVSFAREGEQGKIILRRIALPGGYIYTLLTRPFSLNSPGSFPLSPDDWNALYKNLNRCAALYCNSAFSFTENSPAKAKKLPFATFIIDLQLAEQTLWTKLHAKHRNVIRRAESAALRFSSGEECLDDSYTLYHLSQKRSGNSLISSAKYGDLYKKLQPDVEVFTVYQDTVPVAACLVPFSRRGAIYFYGGVIDKPPSGASNLLHWKTLLWLKDQGIRQYDLFGVRPDAEKNSKYEGLYRFKERFGGDLICGERWTLVCKPLTVGIFNRLRKIKQMMRR